MDAESELWPGLVIAVPLGQAETLTGDYPESRSGDSPTGSAELAR